MKIETKQNKGYGFSLGELLILCRDFGVPNADGITIDPKLSHQAIAETVALPASPLQLPRRLAARKDDFNSQKKKITVHNPVVLNQQFT